MQVIYERCAALDVQKKTVVTTVKLTEPDGSVQEAVRTFSTMTTDLLALDDWLHSLKVDVLAIESPGVFWRPGDTVLEEGRTIILVNAQHMKAVPGRKTDEKDSQWLAHLLRHGLLKASFIPPPPIRELRELTRYRKTLVQERAREVNRLQKVLETANIKLAAIATDILGKSGRDMLNAVVLGEDDPPALAELARGRLRAKVPQLRLALEGRVQSHHRFLLTRILAHIDFREASITNVQQEIDAHLSPFEEALELLQSIPALQETACAAGISEIGTDMERFPSDGHLASWVGSCPGNRESAGKRLSGRTTHGNPYLRALLCEVAWVISRTKDNYLSAFYHRSARRRGKKKAIVALAHKLLIIIYHILRTKKPNTELGADYFDKLDATRIERRAVGRLEQVGYTVTLTPKDGAA